MLRYCRTIGLCIACVVVSLQGICGLESKGETTSYTAVQKILAQADIQINGGRPWDIQVKNPQFYDRLLKDRSLGLGESYMEGWWDSAALDDLMFRILRADLENNLRLNWSMLWAIFKAKFFNTQDKTGSMKVIDAHYQLGNDL